MKEHLTPDDFNYAVENTHVVLEPKLRLATFGTSLLRYYLVTEDMDQINVSRVREGQIHAERPQIISPHSIAKLMLEGFGEKAQQFADAMKTQPQQFTFLKYGFSFKKDEFRTYDVHQQFDTVVGTVTEQVTESQDPFSAVITGVDDGWEVCLLKFMCDLIQDSTGQNIEDFRNRGLL